MVASTYFWDPIEDNVVFSANDLGVVTVLHSEPTLFGPVISVDENGSKRFLHSDASGSVVAATDDAQTVHGQWAYSAYGDLTESTTDLVASLGYCGRVGYLWTTNSNFDVRRRVLEPSTARWCTVDPEPWIVSDYLYVDNRPTAFRDPSGLRKEMIDPCRPLAPIPNVSPPISPVLLKTVLTCSDFVTVIYPTLPPSDNPDLDRARRCGAIVTCDPNCPSAGYTSPPAAAVPPGPCNVCFDSSLTGTLHFWLGLLLHEGRHIQQFYNSGYCGCPPAPPRPRNLRVDPTNCNTCQTREDAAYTAQIRYLYPHYSPQAQRYLVELGICNSCEIACSENAAFRRACRYWRRFHDPYLIA